MAELKNEWIVRETEQGYRHVLPVNDTREHLPWQCWCEPTYDPEVPEVIVHNAEDGREQFETGGRKPS